MEHCSHTYGSILTLHSFSLLRATVDYGGAVWVNSGAPHFTNCTFTGNNAATCTISLIVLSGDLNVSSTDYGGAVSVFGSTTFAFFNACTFSANAAASTSWYYNLFCAYS